MSHFEGSSTFYAPITDYEEIQYQAGEENIVDSDSDNEISTTTFVEQYQHHDSQDMQFDFQVSGGVMQGPQPRLSAMMKKVVGGATGSDTQTRLETLTEEKYSILSSEAIDKEEMAIHQRTTQDNTTTQALNHATQQKVDQVTINHQCGTGRES